MVDQASLSYRNCFEPIIFVKSSTRTCSTLPNPFLDPLRKPLPGWQNLARSQWLHHYSRSERLVFTTTRLLSSALTAKSSVCWDQWYPEAARLTALEGAEIIVYPTAIGWHPAEKPEHGVAQVQAWQLAQRAHGLASGVYIAAVNRHGHEGSRPGGIEFWGHSFVSDPYGLILAEAGDSEDRIIIQECSRGRIEDIRRNWPFLRDRRTDIYGGINRRFGH